MTVTLSPKKLEPDQRTDPDKAEDTGSSPPPSAESSRFSRKEILVALGVFVTVCALLNLVNLLRDGIPMHGDLTYPWRVENFMKNYQYLFTDSGSIPNLESVDRAILLLPLAAVARWIGTDMGFVHLVLFFSVPLTAMISSFFLNAHILTRLLGRKPNLPALIIASIVYALSPWALEQVQAYLFWLAYALTPALILLCLKFFETPRLSLAVWMALCLSFIAVTPQYLIYSVIILVIAGLLCIIWVGRPRESGYGKKVLLYGAAGSGLFLALNWYWIYPIGLLLSNGQAVSPGYELTRESTKLFSLNSSLVNVLRGFDQWIIWYVRDARLNVVFNNLWVLNSLVIPAIAIGSLAQEKVRKSPFVRILLLISVVFILLSLGEGTAFYDWIVFDAPILSSIGWVFRVPGKMSYVPWTFYSLMLAWALHQLFSGTVAERSRTRFEAYFSERRRSFAGRALLGGALTFSVLLLILPKTIVYFTDYYAPVSVPSGYSQLEDFLAQEDGIGRALYLAPYAGAFGRNELRYETSFEWSPDHLSANTPASSSPIPSIDYYHLTYRDWQETIYQKLENRIPIDVGSRLLAPIGVRYLVHHDDIVHGEEMGAQQIRQLERSDLELAATFPDGITVWSNPVPLTLFEPELSDSYDAPLVERPDPTRYELSFEDDVPPAILMGQPFDPQWNLAAGDAIVEPTRTNDGYMRFDLPPDSPSEVSVFYSLQGPYEAGLAISGGTALVVLLGCAGLWVVRYRRRRGTS